MKYKYDNKSLLRLKVTFSICIESLRNAYVIIKNVKK